MVRNLGVRKAAWRLAGWLVLWAGSGSAAMAQELVVAELGTYARQQSMQSTFYLAGVQAAFEQANRAGGVNGRRVVLARAPEPVEPAQAAAELKRVLAEHKPVALVGFLGDGSVRALAAGGLERERIALVGAQNADDELDSPAVFRTRAGLAEELAKVCQQLGTIGLTRLASFTEEGPQGERSVRLLQELPACKGLTLVARTSQPAGKVHAPGAVEALLKAAPQAVIIVSSPAAAAGLIENYRLEGGGATLFASSSVDVERLAMRLGEQYLRGVSIAQVVPSPYRIANRLTKDFVDARALLKDPPPVSYTMMEGYVTGRVLLAGLRKAGNAPSRDTVLAALDALEPQDLGGYQVAYGRGNRRGARFVELTIVDAGGRVRQ
ncbi:ABC transporter substrate-binding protein [Aquabacterium sp. J223]|uniref:ABC transporter substrate-binding protein n=1 Tax=Aquabacterium sp. J223 TaxID=2898431 RepID=UPI0021ADD129|nr:ABC transporter substrate-binding protein [Aquabacterium sp. J223]UUX95688.1 ABC transporter substrate-binding protein [Aquabacterium sp. J223]